MAWRLCGRGWQNFVYQKSLRHLKIAAIGPATKKAIEKRGVKVQVVPEEYIAESVVKSLKGEVRGKRVLLVRAKVARDVIPRELRKAGAQVDVFEAYERWCRIFPYAIAGGARECEGRPDVITFTSSSTVKNFVTLLSATRGGAKKRPPNLEGITLASIGPVTSGTLRELHLGVDVEAQEYTIPGLIAAIVARLALCNEKSPWRSTWQAKLSAPACCDTSCNPARRDLPTV